MSELRFVAACLEGGGKSFPTPEYFNMSSKEKIESARRGFYQLLDTLPNEFILPIEDAALHLACAYAEEGFERGFSAGMRLMNQTLHETILFTDRRV